jgi:hypothetical protein
MFGGMSHRTTLQQPARLNVQPFLRDGRRDDQVEVPFIETKGVSFGGWRSRHRVMSRNERRRESSDSPRRLPTVNTWAVRGCHTRLQYAAQLGFRSIRVPTTQRLEITGVDSEFVS